MTNHELVGKALTLVRDAVRPKVEEIWRARYGVRWRDQANNRLPHRDRHANPDDLIFLLKGMDATWDQFFRDTLSRSTRSYLHLLWEARNRWAHNERFNSEQTLRILDHCEMMLEAFHTGDSATQVRELKRQVFTDEPDETPWPEQMSLREILKNILSAPVPPNEETAKLQILVPIMQRLGWSLSRQEIIFEFQVGDGRVDIALRGPDRIVALIEAKAPHVNLDRHVGQVVKYAFDEGVDICVLTNGLEWWLYLPMQPRVRFEERRFATLRIREDPLEQLQADLEAFLSRENLVNGTARRLAEERWMGNRRDEKLKKAITEAWRRMAAGPDEGLLDLVGQRVHEQTDLQPTRDEVKSALRPLTAPSPVPGPQPPRPQPPGPSHPSPDPGTKGKPSGIWLWGEYQPVSSWIRVLLLVLEALHNHHGPDTFERALSRLVTRSPDTLSRPVQVGTTGFWINRSIPIPEIRRRSYACLEKFGHPPTDLEIICI